MPPRSPSDPLRIHQPPPSPPESHTRADTDERSSGGRGERLGGLAQGNSGDHRSGLTPSRPALYPQRMTDDDEPKLIGSSKSLRVILDGNPFSIEIYRLEDEAQWT